MSETGNMGLLPSHEEALHFDVYVRRSLGSFLTKHLIKSYTKINYTGGTSNWRGKVSPATVTNAEGNM